MDALIFHPRNKYVDFICIIFENFAIKNEQNIKEFVTFLTTDLYKILKMTFWQENYAFIKDVYDTRATKLFETMTKTDQSIADVVADKIYTSAEFKKVKEVFMVRNKKI